jgi:hypothetical protein
LFQHKKIIQVKKTTHIDVEDPKVGPRTKQQKKKKLGARFIIHNTLGVGGHAKASGWD